jgi:hypothetical protein
MSFRVAYRHTDKKNAERIDRVYSAAHLTLLEKALTKGPSKDGRGR